MITERELEITINVENLDPTTVKCLNTDTVKSITDRLMKLKLVDNSHPKIFVSSKVYIILFLLILQWQVISYLGYLLCCFNLVLVIISMVYQLLYQILYD